MPIPMEYWNASKDFDLFLTDVRDTCMLQTHNQAYHTLRAVLHVFRSHLDINEALRFADVLPPVIRAIFIESWDANRKPPAFPTRGYLQAEVKSIRPDHNLAPPTAIDDVSICLWRSSVSKMDLERTLKSI
jgi:uncharacterized protein (DUF2267 family)